MRTSSLNFRDHSNPRDLFRQALTCIKYAVLVAGLLIWLFFFSQGSASQGTSKPTPTASQL